MDYPKYVLKVKKLNKNKDAIIFRRNYLSFTEFSKTETGWYLEEEFIHYGTKCKFSVTVNTPDLTQIFVFNSKTLKIKGKNDNFGLFVRLGNRKMPFVSDLNYELIQIHIECSGKGLAYDDGTGIKNTREKQIQKKLFNARKQKKSDEVAPYVGAGYAMTHPYQGGGVSHR